MKAIAGQWMDETNALLDRVVVVALGGNLGGSAAVQERFEAAIAALSTQWGPAKSSALLLTAPVGAVRDQPDFVNAVAAWRPPEPVSPEEALAELMRIETFHGRTRELAGGARTLDLDLLLVGGETRSAVDLVLPHARMHKRAFVLQPLLELFGGGLRLGGQENIAELLASPELRSQQTRPLL